MTVWAPKPPLATVRYMPERKLWTVYGEGIATSYHHTEWRALCAKAKRDRWTRKIYEGLAQEIAKEQK